MLASSCTLGEERRGRRRRCLRCCGGRRETEAHLAPRAPPAPKPGVEDGGDMAIPFPGTARPEVGQGCDGKVEPDGVFLCCLGSEKFSEKEKSERKEFERKREKKGVAASGRKNEGED